MKLMFSVTKSGDDEVARFTSAESTVVAGNGADATVMLPGLPDTVFTISRMDDGIMVFERSQDDVPIILDGETVTDKSIHVTNGSEIDVGDYRILLTVSFDRAAYSSRNSVAVMLSAALIIIILLGELAVATWLPKQIRQSELWGTEILRQTTLQSLDNLRGRVNHHIRKNEIQDPLVVPTLKLYKKETDRLAMYVRANQSKLNVTQLKQLDQDLKTLHRQVNLLTRGKLIPPARRLDVKAAVDMILNEKEK